MNRRRRLVIGISACWLHADEKRDLYNGRSLLYVEQSMAEWLMAYGAGVPVMIPGARESRDCAIGAAAFAEIIDGLLLHGGVDVAPESYGEVPIKPEWSGDVARDAYEIALVRSCLERDRPILGICRGQQLLNVALGGTLYQDICTEVEGAIEHRHQERYHENTHRVEFEPGARLRDLYEADAGIVNSVHHQAVRELGDGLRVEARSAQDGIVEALRLKGDRYVAGVQWHPEFQEPHQSELLATKPLLDDFFEAIRSRRAS